MTWLGSFGRALVIAPHPDDEILGVGGTIARLTKAGHEVFVAVVTTGRPPDYSAAETARVRAEAARAHALLGVADIFWLNLPAARLAETSHAVQNEALGKIVKQVEPATLFVPFAGDIHMDHQLTFLSAMVAARPHQAAYPGTILAYETLSETNWNAPYLAPTFAPNVFVDITDTLAVKLEAMAMYESQVRCFPHERSTEALKALATLRGATVHRPAAEAFVLVRNVVFSDQTQREVHREYLATTYSR
jgi:LmbE family N-acetylglucosaminyl deacetylase